eukprot:3419871-Rhodomonas_salina.5
MAHYLHVWWLLPALVAFFSDGGRGPAILYFMLAEAQLFMEFSAIYGGIAASIYGDSAGTVGSGKGA